MRKALFVYLMLCIFPCLHAEKRIELVANFAADLDRLNAALSHKPEPFKVVRSDLSHYAGLKKDRSFIGNILRKYSLDFPRHIDLRPDVQKIVFWNCEGSYKKHCSLNKFPKEKMILFLWEPPTVIPKIYSKKLHAAFSKVYTWDDDLVDGKKYFKFYYPVWQPMREVLPKFEERKLLTLLATNFAPKRPHTLYPERKKALEFFESHIPEEFEFYGRGWQASEHPCFRGYVNDKIATISQYKFSICFENTAACKGYISEKIFDCFAAGNIPVYWGAPNISDYIPKDCFIDMRDFANYDELLAHLKGLTKEQYEGYILRIREYLMSERAREFSLEHFDDIFYEGISTP